jgi:hypothetical protein
MSSWIIAMPACIRTSSNLSWLAVMLVLLDGAMAADAAPESCFAASKSYTIKHLSDGLAIKDGWTIEGGTFNQCVHRAEAADRELHAKYPDIRYGLSLAATVGCHSPCNG